ncbi:hypothetical protein BLOT_008453 [Blomia tropicalis]|nr:hypothetical protein BLOT_008453 [Blomia tropicalis]
MQTIMLNTIVLYIFSITNNINRCESQIRVLDQDEKLLEYYEKIEKDSANRLKMVDSICSIVQPTLETIATISSMCGAYHITAGAMVIGGVVYAGNKIYNWKHNNLVKAKSDLIHRIGTTTITTTTTVNTLIHKLTTTFSMIREQSNPLEPNRTNLTLMWPIILLIIIINLAFITTNISLHFICKELV